MALSSSLKWNTLGEQGSVHFWSQLGGIKIRNASQENSFSICLKCIWDCLGHFEFIAVSWMDLLLGFASNVFDPSKDYVWIHIRKWKCAPLFLLFWPERESYHESKSRWFLCRNENELSLCAWWIFVQCRFRLLWIILYAFHLLIVLRCLYCDVVYSRSNVLTGRVSDGVSIGASLQIVSII